MRELFEPKSVVLIGVSRQTGVGAYNGLEMLLRYGYRGRIYVVHPKATEILGQKVYPRVQDLPEVPELAIIAVGRDLVVGGGGGMFCKRHTLAGNNYPGICRRRHPGEKIAGEVSGRGPSTPGSHCRSQYHGRLKRLYLFFHGLRRSCLSSPTRPRFPLVAQSGALQVGAESFTGPLGKAVDLGNAADVGFVEVLEYFEQDPQTKVIALHIEGLIEGRAFLNTAARVNRHKPLVILKTGVSQAGAKAALSHTGSMVGQDQVFTAACARAGLTRVHTARGT